MVDHTRPGSGASQWDGVELAQDPDAPVAVGGDLRPRNLYAAYQRGIYPWPPRRLPIVQMLAERHGEAVESGAIPNLDPEQPASLKLPWWRNDPRWVIPVDEIHVSRSLVRFLRRSDWTITVDTAFRQVVEACARGEDDTWISPDVIDAYCALAEHRLAHCVEVRDADGRLVGGVYGVRAGAVLSGESMFRTESNASKVAVLAFARRFQRAGGAVIDVQVESPHGVDMGARPMPVSEFVSLCDRPDLGPIDPEPSNARDLVTAPA